MFKGILLFVCLYSGCSSFTDEELWIKVENAKGNRNWDSTMQVAQKILNEFPDGRYAGWARFALAESHRFKNQPREALDNYKMFVEHYPAMQPAAVSLFLVGYIYNNNLQLYDSAMVFYKKFLEKYPDHELVPSIRLELETLGKSPQQVLESATKREQQVANK